MKKVERKLLVEAVEKIISKNGSEIFRDPVDWKQYGLFDYLTIIRKPMDLRTVLNSLNSDSYSSIERCTSDIRQIWQNAMIYNAPGSKVYIAAQHMSQVWEQMFASIFSKYEDCSRPPNLQEMSEWVGMCQRYCVYNWYLLFSLTIEVLQLSIVYQHYIIKLFFCITRV